MSIPHDSEKTSKWYYLKDGFYSAYENMARDEVLFRNIQADIIDRPILRTYGFSSDAVTFGVCQKIKNDSLICSFNKRSNNFTRRITGGGIVFHRNDLTYSIASRVNAHSCFCDLEFSYEKLHSIVKDSFENFGHRCSLKTKENPVFMGDKQCFSTPVNNDVMIDDQKVAGAAQKRSHGNLLHQGSILLEGMIENERSFGNTYDEFLEVFLDVLSEALNVKFEPFVFRPDDLPEVERYVESKYSQDKWIRRH